MRACRLKLLGGFAFTSAEGADLALPTRKDRLLLAYLALASGRPQERSRLAGLLWGDRGETQARDSLRQSLAALRQTFKNAGIDGLKTERDSVALETAALSVDALDLAAAVESAPARAVALYAGDLLEGVDGVTPEYEAWLRPEREHLSGLAITALERLAEQTSSAADCSVALHCGRRLIAADPTREQVTRSLMRLLARQGERSEALKLYGACRDALKRDLEVAPDARTEALYRNILTADARPPRQEAGSEPPAVQEQPTIAVLPFRDLSSDGSLDSLCEILGEELITGLGRFRELLVIDRTSAAAVAATSADLAEIGSKLGADLLVQGSLQRQSENIRITVRLVKAATRIQLWSEAFELPVQDIMTVPGNAVARIVAILHGRVEHSLAIDRRPQPNLSAYACLLKGVKHLRGYGPDDNQQAIALFDQALTLDPDYHLAKLYRAFADVVLHGYGAAPQAVLDTAVAVGILTTEAVPDDGRGHFLLGAVYSIRGEHDQAGERYRRAIELNPNDANAIAVSGFNLADRGEVDAGIERFRLAMRLNPHHPDWYWDDLGAIFYIARRYEDAVDAMRRNGRPTMNSLPLLAASLAHLGRDAEVRAVKAQILERNPRFTISNYSFRGWSPEQAEHVRAGMHKADLPE